MPDTSDQKLYKMIEEISEKKATEVYHKLGTQYSVPSAPAHSHNGIDTGQLNTSDLVQGDKYGSTLFITPDPQPTGSVTIGGVYNPTRIVFMGFTANNADASPATRRAIVNGEIDFGPSFLFADMSPPLTIQTSGNGTPFLQFSNMMFVDSTDLTKNRVASSVTDFIYAIDDTGAVIARGTVTGYNNQTGILTIFFTLGTDSGGRPYQISGGFVIT